MVVLVLLVLPLHAVEVGMLEIRAVRAATIAKPPSDIMNWMSGTFSDRRVLSRAWAWLCVQVGGQGGPAVNFVKGAVPPGAGWGPSIFADTQYGKVGGAGMG